MGFSLFIVITLVSLVSTQHMQWRQFKYVNISNGAGASQITVQTEIFVRKSHSFHFWMSQCHKKRDNAYNRLLCAEMCMFTPNCLTWMYNPSTHNCYRCDRVYGTTAFIFEDYFSLDRGFELYEKVVKLFISLKMSFCKSLFVLIKRVKVYLRAESFTWLEKIMKFREFNFLFWRKFFC